MDSILTDFNLIQCECRWAVRRFLKGRRASSDEYDDLMQEAFVIAYSPRGKKEIRTPLHLFYKIYYGLIDWYRKVKKTVRNIQRKKGPRPRAQFINSEAAVDEGVRSISESRWKEFDKESFLLVKPHGAMKRYAVPLEECKEHIKKALASVTASNRKMVLMLMNGAEKNEIIDALGIKESTYYVYISEYRKKVLESIRR